MIAGKHMVAAAAAVLAAVVAAGGPASAVRAPETSPTSGPLLGEFVETHTVRLGAGKRMLSGSRWRGGAFTTAAGEVVTVYVSSSYAEEETGGQRWADFFASLIHGGELSSLVAYVAPPAEVAEICRHPRALGCYDGQSLVTIGDASQGVPPAWVAMHEYGHHVAAHRVNLPWNAVDWGTKRWASHANVCARTASRTAFPGDEGARYSLNPGEAFAEAYRVLNEVRSGAVEFAWPIVDRSFLPDPVALERVEEDVLNPWVAPGTARARSQLTRGRSTWSRTLATPLDGELTATLRFPPGTGYELVLAGSRGRVVSTGQWTGTGRKEARYTVCGRRSLTVKVAGEGTRASSRFVLETTHP